MLFWDSVILLLPDAFLEPLETGRCRENTVSALSGVVAWYIYRLSSFGMLTSVHHYILTWCEGMAEWKSPIKGRWFTTADILVIPWCRTCADPHVFSNTGDLTVICGSRGLWVYFQADLYGPVHFCVFCKVSQVLQSTRGWRPVKAGRQGEAARMGESNSPKLSKAVLGCHNKKAQGTFSWVPPWVRSSVASHMAELTLPSGEWRSSTLVFLMTNIL